MIYNQRVARNAHWLPVFTVGIGLGTLVADAGFYFAVDYFPSGYFCRGYFP